MNLISSLFRINRKNTESSEVLNLNRFPYDMRFDYCYEIGEYVWEGELLSNLPRFYERCQKYFQKGEPKWFRLSGSSKWIPFKRIKDYYERLKPSPWQLKKLTGAEGSEEWTYSKIVQQVEILERKEREIKQSVQKEKDALPPTKLTLTKMAEAGIEYREGMNRGDCKVLLQKHQEKLRLKQRKAEEAERFKELKEKAQQLNAIIPPKATIEALEAFTEDPPTPQQKGRFDESYGKYREMGGKRKFNLLMTSFDIDDASDLFEDGFEHAEYLVEGIKDGYYDGSDFCLEIEGVSGSEEFDDFVVQVIDKHLKEQDEFNEASLIKKCFPHLVVRKPNF